MSEKPDVGDGCVSLFVHKKILNVCTRRVRREIVRQMAAIKSSGSRSAAKRDGLVFPDL